MRMRLFRLPAVQLWALQLFAWALVTSPGMWQPPPVPSAPQLHALSHRPVDTVLSTGETGWQTDTATVPWIVPQWETLYASTRNCRQ